MKDQDGEEITEGRKWKLYEILDSNLTEDRMIEGPNGRTIQNEMPIIAPKVDRNKHELEVQIKTRGNFNPKITVEPFSNDSQMGSEGFIDGDAIVSFELSEENLRKQLGISEVDDSVPPMEFIFLLDCIWQ